MTASPIRVALRALRASPTDPSTEAGRSSERNRRIAWTGLSAAAAKGATAGAMLITVPVTLGYLGQERFGLWMAVAATVSMLTFADFGLGNGLMTAVARAHGSDDVPEMQRLSTSAFLMLSVVAVGLGLLFVVLYPSISWAEFFNVTSERAVAEVGPLVAALMVCFLLNLPATATSKIQLGLQRGYVANAWEVFGSLAGLVGILIAVRMDAGLVWIGVAMAGVPVLARTLNSLVFLAVQSPVYRPRLHRFDLSTARRLFRIGGLFFVLQVAVVVGFQSDNIVIARLIGAEAVASYDITFKLAMLPAMLVSFIVLAQWPAYAEAAERGDMPWVRATFARTLRTSLGVGLAAGALLLVLGRVVIQLWAGPAVVPDRLLLACMALWSVLFVVGNAISALLNGLNVVAFQAVSSSFMAVANILLSIYLVGRLGVVGAVMGSLIAYTLITFLPCLLLSRRLLGASQEVPRPHKDLGPR